MKNLFDILDNNEDHDLIKKKLNIEKYPSFVVVNNNNILETKLTSNIEEIECMIKYL